VYIINHINILISEGVKGDESGMNKVYGLWIFHYLY